MYEELKNKSHEPRRHTIRPPPTPENERIRTSTITTHPPAIMQTQIANKFEDFSSDINAAIDRIIDRRLREGSQEISRITTTLQDRYVWW